MNKFQATIGNVYPIGLQWTMYNHYLDLYQSRYTVRTPQHTWAHIRYWKHWLFEYGQMLMANGELTAQEFKAARMIVIDEQDGIKIDIEVRKKQIPD